MRIGFAGTPAVAVQVLESLSNTEHDLALVITKPDAQVGRGKRLEQSEVSAFAESQGLKVIKPNDLTDMNLITLIKEMNLDLILVVAYGKIIPAQLLQQTKFGWFNLHFSLLPKYRGAAPVQHSLLAGDTVTGVTLFKLDSGMDTGAIYRQSEYQISEDDDAISVLSNLAVLGSSLVLMLLADLTRGELQLFSQEQQASYAAKIQKQNMRIDWKSSAIQIRNLVRAGAAGPIAFTENEQYRILIHEVAQSETSELLPGHVEQRNGEIFVGTGSGDLRLLKVQPAGKRTMFAREWINGLRDSEIIFS